MKYKRLTLILAAIPILLLIPMIAMQFTTEVKWTLIDFVAAAVLLLSAALTLEFIFRKVKTTKIKIIFIIVLVLIVLIIWTELAVGIFGTPFAGH